MERIDPSKRKPRRTKGTPSYYYRNRVAAVGLLAGTAIFALFYCTPIFRFANENILRVLNTVSEEEKERKLLLNLVAAPRSSKAIQQTIEEKKQLASER